MRRPKPYSAPPGKPGVAARLDVRLGHTPYTDALSLVRGALSFSGWAFVQVEQGTRGKVCALAGRRFGLRPGRAVTWPKYWRAWLEQGEVVQVPDTRANEALPATPLLQLHAIGTYIIAPALAADGRLHGLLLGMGSMRRPTTLPTQQLCIVQAAARLLSCVGKLEERLAAAERRAAHMLEESLRDELTGVANRRGIEQALRQEADRLRGRDHEVTVLFVDLDGLKRVNDDHGHDAGDALICNAAQALIQAARGGDTVGRLGGDELVVVLPRRHSSTSVEATVARFAEALHAAGVPASIGAASTEETGSVHAAVTLADKRMLAHKRKARRHPLSVPSERE